MNILDSGNQRHFFTTNVFSMKEDHRFSERVYEGNQVIVLYSFFSCGLVMQQGRGHYFSAGDIVTGDNYLHLG